MNMFSSSQALRGTLAKPIAIVTRKGTQQPTVNPNGATETSGGPGNAFVSSTTVAPATTTSIASAPIVAASTFSWVTWVVIGIIAVLLGGYAWKKYK
jgi:hypothetical protein